MLSTLYTWSCSILILREYQEGWAELPGRNRDLEYRLTIDNAQIEDSGTYRCSTPARYTHEVNIEVTSMWQITQLSNYTSRCKSHTLKRKHDLKLSEFLQRLIAVLSQKVQPWFIPPTALRWGLWCHSSARVVTASLVLKNWLAYPRQTGVGSYQNVKVSPTHENIDKYIIVAVYPKSSFSRYMNVYKLQT